MQQLQGQSGHLELRQAPPQQKQPAGASRQPARSTSLSTEAAAQLPSSRIKPPEVSPPPVNAGAGCIVVLGVTRGGCEVSARQQQTRAASTHPSEHPRAILMDPSWLEISRSLGSTPWVALLRQALKTLGLKKDHQAHEHGAGCEMEMRLPHEESNLGFSGSHVRRGMTHAPVQNV